MLSERFKQAFCNNFFNEIDMMLNFADNVGHISTHKAQQIVVAAASGQTTQGKLAALSQRS